MKMEGENRPRNNQTLIMRPINGSYHAEMGEFGGLKSFVKKAIKGITTLKGTKYILYKQKRVLRKLPKSIAEITKVAHKRQREAIRAALRGKFSIKKSFRAFDPHAIAMEQARTRSVRESFKAFDPAAIAIQQGDIETGVPPKYQAAIAAVVVAAVGGAGGAIASGIKSAGSYVVENIGAGTILSGLSKVALKKMAEKGSKEAMAEQERRALEEQRLMQEQQLLQQAKSAKMKKLLLPVAAVGGAGLLAYTTLKGG